MKWTITILLLLQFIFFACGQKNEKYVTSVPNQQQFEALQGKPLAQKYGNVTAVKVVYDIDNDKLYFIDSYRYKYHREFCEAQFKVTQPVKEFNDHNYSENKHRKYVLPTINYYKHLNLYTVEFSTGEEYSSINIEVYNRIKEKVFFADRLKLFPTTNQQIETVNNIAPKIAIATPDEIYGALQYQPLNKTFSYGYLKFIDIKNIEETPIDKHDIVITNGTPNEIQLCAGVVTTQFQTPLSHINVLCQNRKTPLAAYKKAWESDVLRSLENELVEFRVFQDTFIVRKAEQETADKFWKNTSKQSKSIKLKKNLKVAGLIDVDLLNYGYIKYAGGKAAHFGELNKILKTGESAFKIPEGAFAIPFYYYEQHLERNGLDSVLIAMLSDEAVTQTPTLLDSALASIRKQIEEAPISKVLLGKLHAKMDTLGFESLRFRSSTNAEDIKGFNGAGLYDSKTGIRNHETKTVERAVKRVWASLWNLRAFQEREYFGIDHSTVAMGVLAHRRFPDEKINGVAITKNIYRPLLKGHVINCQVGEESIVSPPEGVTCEQMVILDGWKYHSEANVADYLSYSSINEGKPILNNAEIMKIRNALTAIKTHFYYNVPNNNNGEFLDFALDIEFKLDGENRQLYIKQARYF